MRIGHVHLKVNNLERSEEFYCELLGAKRTEHLPNQFTFLSLGSAHHDIALQELRTHAGTPLPGMLGLYHVAFESSDAKKFLQTMDKLDQRQQGYSLVDYGISWALYTSDPDGNGVEVFLDRRSHEEGTSFWNGLSKRLSRGHVELETKPAS